MKPYNVGDCIGSDEEDYNKIFLGRPNRYNTFDLDYETNVKPYLIRNFIQTFSSKLKKDDFVIVSREQGLDMVSRYYLPIFSQCFELEWVSKKQVEDFAHGYNGLKGFSEVLGIIAKKDTLSGTVANLEETYRVTRKLKEISGQNEEDDEKPDILKMLEGIDDFDEDSEEEEKRHNILNLIRFLDIASDGLKFKDNIPESMYDLIKDFVYESLAILQMTYRTEIPERYVQEIKWEKAEHPISETEAFKIENLNGVRAAQTMLILNGFEFKTKNDCETLHSLMNYGDRHLLLGVCFQECSFNGNACRFSEIFGHVMFQSCTIEKKLSLGFVLDGEIEFDNCTIIGDLDLSRLQLDRVSTVKIMNSFFKKGSKLNCSEIHFGNQGYHAIDIKDSIIEGDCDFSGIRDSIFLNLKNVYFMKGLKTLGTKVEKNSTIENLGFPSQYNSEIEKSRKELYETLKASGLENKAKELDILPKETSKKSSKFDMDAYQVAYSSGFLNPDQAAFCISKSKVYLAKKRQNDRKKITQKSLPFIISGKDIQYPVEALLAFKVGDWNRLKELRQKYPIPKDEN